MTIERVFLDANVLFSAAYRKDSGLNKLWDLENIILLTSRYALEEALANLERPDHIQRLEKLTRSVELVPEGLEFTLPKEIKIAEKDRPIILAAIAAGATHLLTGDIKHFDNYFGRRIQGILVLRPAQYLKGRN